MLRVIDRSASKNTINQIETNRMVGKPTTKLKVILTVVTPLILGSTNIFSQVTTTEATGGGSISADDTGVSWTTLTGPILTETSKNDFAEGTITFTIPSGFEWNTTGITLLIEKAGTQTQKLLMSQGTHSSSVLTFNITQQSGAKGGKGPAKITFQNVQVRPTSPGTVTSGNIVWGGTAYSPGANAGALAMVAGAANKLSFMQEPTDATAGATLSPSVTVQVQDQYSNNLSPSGTSITLAPSTSSLNGTLTQSTSSGVATYNNLSMNTAGSYTLSATSSGLSGTTSASFIISAGTFSTTNSTISVSSSYITNNGSSTSTVTVQLVDAFTNSLTTGGETVVISTTAGTLPSTVADNTNGSYTQNLQSSTNEEYATITATVNASAISNSGSVGFTPATTVWTSNGSSTDWSSASNWTNGVPISSSVVLIPTTLLNGTAYPNGANGSTISQMIIESGGTFTLSGGISFTVDGDLRGLGAITGSTSDALTVNGDLNIPSFTMGTLILGGSATQTLAGNYTGLTNLTVNKTGLANAQGNLSISGTLTLTAGTLVMASGTNLIAGTTTKTSGESRFERELVTNPGWRLLSSPAVSTYGDFLDKIFTQGYTGSSDDTLSPSVLYYDESYAGTDNQRWRKPNNSTETLTAGRGLFVYVFGSTADPLYNIPFPVTIDVDGSENEGVASEFDFGATYTTTADSGWNLIGNPFGSTIDWDNFNWTKTNMDGSIYIWNPNSNGGSGSYLSWNGTVGTLGDGLIAPFQGFWVKANAATPVLKVGYSAKTQGTSFLGKINEEPPHFYIKAESNDFQEKIFFMFSEEGHLSEDPLDAYWLTPPTGSYMEFNSLRESRDRMVIQNLPLKFGIPLEIPIRLNLVSDEKQIDGDIEINWGNIGSLPEGWSVTLVDNTTDNMIDLRRKVKLSLDKVVNQSSIAGITPIPQKLLPSTHAKFMGRSDFTLVIDPGNSFPEIPREFALNQNYPNPFNARTIFPLLLPLEARVTFNIYNLLGRKIDTLLDNELMPGGQHNLNWHAHNLPTGVYFSQVIINNRLFTKKFMVMK